MDDVFHSWDDMKIVDIETSRNVANNFHNTCKKMIRWDLVTYPIQELA